MDGRVSDAINDPPWLVYKSSIETGARACTLFSIRLSLLHKWWNFSILIAQQCTWTCHCHRSWWEWNWAWNGHHRNRDGMLRACALTSGTHTQKLMFDRLDGRPAGRPARHSDIRTVIQPAHSSTINLIYVSKRLISISLPEHKERRC